MDGDYNHKYTEKNVKSGDKTREMQDTLFEFLPKLKCDLEICSDKL